MSKFNIWIGFLSTMVLTALVGIFLSSINTKYIDCGVVIDKYNSEKIYRKSSRVYINPTFIVKYNDLIEDVYVDTNTYYTNEIGDKVCFERTIEDKRNNSIFCFILLISSLFAILITSLYKIADEI